MKEREKITLNTKQVKKSPLPKWIKTIGVSLWKQLFCFSMLSVRGYHVTRGNLVVFIIDLEIWHALLYNREYINYEINWQLYSLLTDPRDDLSGMDVARKVQLLDCLSVAYSSGCLCFHLYFLQELILLTTKIPLLSVYHLNKTFIIKKAYLSF